MSSCAVAGCGFTTHAGKSMIDSKEAYVNVTMKKLLLVWLGSYTLLALLIFYAYVVGKVPLRLLGVEYAGLFVVAAIVLTNMLRRNRKNANSVADVIPHSSGSSEPKAARETVRKYRVAIVLMSVILIYGIWDRKGSPLWVTLVGAAINVAIIAALVLIVRAKNSKFDH
jgi:hypothetical protein